MVNRDSVALFGLQVLSHAGLFILLIHGRFDLLFFSFLVYFITGCFGMTMTYHRLLAHKSWNAPKWFEWFGTIAGTYGLVGSSIAWTAIHKEHHRHTDDEQDPHAPSIKGFIEVQWLSMFEQPKLKYVTHLLRRPLHTFLHKHYLLIHVAILAALLIVAGPMWTCALYLAPAAILWNAGSLINTATHLFGYRNHETDDDSTNIHFLGYLMWGEGWHNNHHAKPTKSQFGEKWWEYDVGGVFIKLLERRQK